MPFDVIDQRRIDTTGLGGNLGLGDSATLDVGTTSGTVAAGDDARIVGAAQKSANLSDLASASTARTNLGLGTAAVEDATAFATAAQGAKADAALPRQTLSLVQLKALPTASVSALYQDPGGISCVMKWVSGDFSAQIAADTVGAFFVKADGVSEASGAWVRQDRLLSLKYFGVTLDNTGDNTAAVQAALTVSSFIDRTVIVPLGKIRVAGPLMASGNVTLQGLGPELSEIVFSGNDGISIDVGTSTSFVEGGQVNVRGVGFRSETASTTLEMLSVSATGGAGATFSSLYIEDCLFGGEGDEGGFGRAITLSNCRNVSIRGIRVYGSRTYFNSQVGIEILGDSSPVEIFVDQSIFYFCAAGILMGGTSEGLYVNHCAFIGDTIGIQVSTDTVKPLIAVSNSHFNCTSKNIQTNNLVQFNIHDNLMYAWPDSTSSVSIEINMNDTSVGLTSSIKNNILIGTAQVAGSKQGILFQGVSGSGQYSAVIDGNILLGFDTGIWLTPNVSGVKVGKNNRFTSIGGSEVLDQGTGNIIAIDIVHSGRVISAVGFSGLEQKAGTVSVTLDAGGNGTISYPTPFKSNTRTAVVCNGDGSTEGDAVFSAYVALADANGLPFAVRPNPGAVSVTVSYVAYGD